jgi:hypothetical protein
MLIRGCRACWAQRKEAIESEWVYGFPWVAGVGLRLMPASNPPLSRSQPVRCDVVGAGCLSQTRARRVPDSDPTPESPHM